MLSMARYEGESAMLSQDRDIAPNFHYKTTHATTEDQNARVLNTFKESEYERACLYVGRL